MHYIRAQRLARLSIKSEFLLNPRTLIYDDDITGLDQFCQNRPPESFL